MRGYVTAIQPKTNRFNLHNQRTTIFGGELAKPTGLPTPLRPAPGLQ